MAGCGAGVTKAFTGANNGLSNRGSRVVCDLFSVDRGDELFFKVATGTTDARERRVREVLSQVPLA